MSKKKPPSDGQTTGETASKRVYLTENEVADRRRHSVKKLQADRWNCTGIPYVKFGRLVRYDLADVIADEEKNKIVPRDPDGSGGGSSTGGGRS
jgi:hypothetical protein